jgi:hypothetical protein
MESQIDNVQTEKKEFHLYEHPWLSFLAFMVATVSSMALTGNGIFGWVGLSGSSLAGQFAQESSFKILSCFLLVPFILRPPKGKKTYRQFLDDIGLSRMQPFIRLMLLGLSSTSFWRRRRSPRHIYTGFLKGSQ